VGERKIPIPGTIPGIVTRKYASDEDDERFVDAESHRCLQCNRLCNKCVDVCPNRANVAIPIVGFRDPYQILHIDDLCNACGNCETFCPHRGAPYLDKLTLFSSRSEYSESENDGFMVEWPGKASEGVRGNEAEVSFVALRIDGRETSLRIDPDRGFEEVERIEPDSPVGRASVIIRTIVSHHRYLLRRREPQDQS
jgi:putative selenate reductase